MATRNFFDRSSNFIRRFLPPEALELFCILPVDMNNDEDYEHLVAAYVREYLKNRNTHDWFHIKLKAVCFESFLRVIRADGGKTALLPFSCWCDGGRQYEVEQYTQHRHMIAVAPKSGKHFVKNIWLKITTNSRPKRKFPSKTLRKIESVDELIELFGSLSQRMSRCEFSYDAELASDKHFYLFQTNKSTTHL